MLRASWTRRQLLTSTAGVALGAALARVQPTWAQHGAHAQPAPTGGAGPIDLRIHYATLPIGERPGRATCINGSLPGPLVRLREGENAILRVTNALDEDTSIHWHGVLVPAPMDGVPGVSFPGIRPGETFTYEFPVGQSGTYWYHSHSRLQEQTGVYGPLVIEPRDPEPLASERDYVVMLSDWTFKDPYAVLHDLKSRPGYDNFQRRTLGDLFRDVSGQGFRAALAERSEWARMRMDPTDFADVTGVTYTYLLNGLPSESNWTGLFSPGERVRLRLINGSAMTIFDVQIPGLRMTVVQADGQNIQPVVVDELRISVAETYDVVVEPHEERAFTIFAETIDRSGFVRGTLAPRAGLEAAIPKRRARPLRTMADMGMAMSAGEHAGMGAANSESPAPSMPGMEMPAQPPSDSGADTSHGAPPAPAHAQHGAAPAPPSSAGGHAAPEATPEFRHGPDDHGPGNAAIAEAPRDRMAEPGAGLEKAPWRVLVYTDLRSREPFGEPAAPDREIELHLTGNMERYMWSFDGVKFADAKPIPFVYGERLRLVFVNDTMMEHPIHLHGMWMQPENGAGAHLPRKHTVNVKPAERLPVLITVDAPGDWALHCHFLFHMELGMFRVVSVGEHAARGHGA